MIKVGNIIKLSDNQKYMIILARVFNRKNYYYALRATGEDKQFLILEENQEGLDVCEEKDVLEFFQNELITIIKNKSRE